MPESRNNYVFPWYVTYTFAMAAIIISIYAMIQAKPLAMPLMFAMFFAILLAPFCGWLERYKVPRFLAALTGIIITLGVLVILGIFLVNQISSFASDSDMFVERLEELLESVDALLLKWFDTQTELNLNYLLDEVSTYIKDNAATLTKGITGAASTITTFLLMPIFMFLFLLFRDMLKTFIRKAFGRGDEETEQKVDEIIIKVKTLVQKYITGLLMVIAILAVINSTMLLIIGVEHAIFFGVFAAMLNVIPFIGPIMGSILPILYSLITMDSLIYPLIILLGFYIIQLFESNLFTPVIVGRQVSMNALMTLLLILIGSQIWGLAAKILFIPLGAILKVICHEVDSIKPYAN
ncbi:MAG: AI-2E family transporter, partial [Balneolales bacterium]|nr:AI-2E family transporter [Balneolales bacterium]